MIRVLVLAVLLAAAAVSVPAEGGHEVPIYPSFYPHEIGIATIDASAAAARLRSGEIHAFVGAEPNFTSPPGADLAAVVSLGAFVIVAVEPPDCAALWATMHDFADHHPADAVFHPFPVTPFHADYLQHADQVEAAKERVREAVPVAGNSSLEIIGAAALLAETTLRGNGWIGPPWLKAGWFQAYRLLAEALEPADRQRADDDVRRLEEEDFDSLETRLDLERGLLAVLTGNCRRAVAGYTLKREWFDAEYSSGIENVASDSLAGLDAPVFIRTVKLKDFPWNGELRLGIATPPDAAWNPIAGFTDPAGRLIWSAIGDPAAFPAPYSDGWILNRIADITPLR